MSVSFNRYQGLIVLEVELEGPLRTGVSPLALDTGATDTMIDSSVLKSLGYDPTTVQKHVQFTSASGVENVPIIDVKRIKALDHERFSFSVLCHQLPATLSVRGVLGLDFLRGLCLEIDFRSGQITLK